MTKDEFKQAFALANGPQDGRDTSGLDSGLFNGFGLKDFTPVHCTVAMVASLIVYQAKFMFGDGWDAAALDEVATFGRKKFIIVG